VSRIRTPRVLIVEDEEAIAGPLAAALRRNGFAPRIAPTAATSVSEFETWRPHVIVLDLMLPDGDGRDVCRYVRARSDVPIIIVTAKDEPIDRVVGLELGADDYVVKPFSSRELAARIRAVLRRATVGEPASQIEIGDVRIDPTLREASVRGVRLQLPGREFELLLLLMQNSGRVVRREDIMDELWGGDWFGSTKTLDVHIGRLRHRIEAESAESYITTVRGVGFRFATEGDLPSSTRRRRRSVSARQQRAG
jgi:two-component system, OmpR family, response regulator RegX3